LATIQPASGYQRAPEGPHRRRVIRPANQPACARHARPAENGILASVRTGLTIDDLGDLLEQPIVAVLATYRQDGSVMLSPVWFEWRDGAFSIWTGGASEGKSRHVAHDPRASIVVYDQAPPYRGLEASGPATLVSQGFHDVVRRTAARYIGPDRADAFASGYRTPGLVIRITPDRLRAWDFRDEVAEGEGA
jgi:PPOX class probable F420-dependent enzyme